jgi:pimeloyl-ACP methyl ester carboxylesterase
VEGPRAGPDLTALSGGPGRTVAPVIDNAGSDRRTVVLIHGLWLNPRSWEHCIARYAARGHRVLAPGSPGADVEVDELRRDPSALNGLGVTEVADHYEAVVRKLDEPPIIIGHSFGGAITQVLLSRGLGAAGVAVHSAPVKGVFRLPLSSLTSSLPVLRNPANRRRTVSLTPGSSTAGSPTRSRRRRRVSSTTVTTSRRRAGRCGRPPLPTSDVTRRPRSTSTGPTGLPCCWSPVGRTASCRPRSTGRTTGGTARRPP